MRVEITQSTPSADSYGNTTCKHTVFPMKNHDEVNSCIEHFIRGAVHYSIGTTIDIKITEDWTYEG